jgi:hypothetical protein
MRQHLSEWFLANFRFALNDIVIQSVAIATLNPNKNQPALSCDEGGSSLSIFRMRSRCSLRDSFSALRLVIFLLATLFAAHALLASWPVN